MAERHLIKRVVSVSAVVITLTDAASEIDLSAVVLGNVLNKGHLWIYISLYCHIFKQEMLTLKCYYLHLTMYDHNPINEGRN